VTSGTLVLAAVDAIATVIWYSMLEVFAGSKAALMVACRRRVAGAGEIARSDGSGVGGWRQWCDGHGLSSLIDGVGDSRGWQPGAKVSMIIMRSQHRAWRAPGGEAAPIASRLNSTGPALSSFAGTQAAEFGAST
jgi:hypothetical protein